MRTHIEWNVPTHKSRASSADQFCKTRFHLAGGFVGERYGENAPRSDTKFTYEMRDTMRKNARLSTAGSRKNKTPGHPYDG